MLPPCSHRAADHRSEFASTEGGTCAYSLFLFAVPFVVTVNFSTLKLDLLDTHDFLGNPANRVVLELREPPY